MKSILLVEDEEDLINIVGSVLRDEGYEVKQSLTAEEALQLCAGYKPDLIICDVKMGEMDGFVMLEKLKTSEKLKKVPFIFLTAFDEPEGKKEGLRLGADAYITKPFDVDELLRTVRKLVPPK
ncbi:MAG: response regulator [Ignavibacteria bacterium]|nr:response regulator [Ignavibacteria bacterium]